MPATALPRAPGCGAQLAASTPHFCAPLLGALARLGSGVLCPQPRMRHCPCAPLPPHKSARACAAASYASR
eukprot:2860834-Alexandrium_andersonii.AAC.1